MVGVCLERGPELVPTLLGVLNIGAAYLPLDPAYPAQRRNYMVADAGARWLVTERAYADLEFAGHRVLVDDDAAAIAVQPSHSPQQTVSAQNLIY